MGYQRQICNRCFKSAAKNGAMIGFNGLCGECADNRIKYAREVMAERARLGIKAKRGPQLSCDICYHKISAIDESRFYDEETDMTYCGKCARAIK